MKHKHYETLMGLADGAKFPDDFEYINNEATGFWRAAEDGDSHYLMGGYGRFRLKPTPKPDIVETAQVGVAADGDLVMWPQLDNPHNVEFTFSADDLTKPKSVRLLP